MGECGCGEMQADEIFRLGEFIIALEIYPGCHNCNEDTFGASFYAFNEDTASDFMIETDKEFHVEELVPQVNIPIFNAKDLIDANKDAIQDFQNYENLEDWLTDYGLDILRNAYFYRKDK